MFLLYGTLLYTAETKTRCLARELQRLFYNYSCGVSFCANCAFNSIVESNFTLNELSFSKCGLVIVGKKCILKILISAINLLAV